MTSESRTPGVHFRQSVLVALALSTALAAIPAAAELPGNPLTDAQVACDRARLGALAARSHVAVPGRPAEDGTVRALFLTYSNRFGAYEGLVARTEWVVGRLPAVGPVPETILSFHLSPDVRELLLNPARPTLDQVSLTREASTSTLVPPGDPRAIVLRVDPTSVPDPRAEPRPGDLVIDNLSAPPAGGAPGFRAADTQPGRGLTADGITERCHSRFTSFDRRMFAIFQRVLRFTVEPVTAPPEARAPDLRVTLFRQQPAGVFGAEVVLVDPATGEVVEPQATRRLQLALGQDGTGAVDSILMTHEAVPPPGGAWRVTAHLARPGFGAAGPDVLPLGSLPLEELGLPFPAMESVGWDDLLRHTTWTPRGAERNACGLGTPEELAATPRADGNTELLALAMGSGLTAEQELYDRLVSDLASIAAGEPNLVDARFYSSFYDGQSLLLTVEETTGQAIAEGEYDAWNCLDAHYGSTGIFFADPIPTEVPRLVVVRFSGRYHLETLAPGYADLPGVESAGPFGLAPPAVGLPFPSICAQEIEDGTIRYFFEETPSSLVVPIPTYHYESEPGEAPERIGVFGPASQGPPPSWLSRLDECRESLRFGGVE